MISQGIGAPRSLDGQTARQLTEGFVGVATAGAREAAEELRQMARAMGLDATRLLEQSCRRAAAVIQRRYRANVGRVTGNLAASTRIKTKSYPNGATIAVVGPWQSGRAGSMEGQESGNHAWMVEFGTDRRRPGTQGRRTYLNVHQMINMRMTRAGSFNNSQFANMSRGHYFLMGAINEPTRQALWGRGGDHDFWTPPGQSKSRPVTLHPGETYGEMPASHAMQRAIEESGQETLNALITSIRSQMEELV